MTQKFYLVASSKITAIVSGLLCMVVFCFSSCTERALPISRNFDRVACSSQSSSVTIDELPVVNNRNVSNYKLSGTCERNRSEIFINIEGSPLNQHPICSSGQWEVYIDISGLINKKERFQVAVSQGSSNSNMLCQQVQNYFVCPDNYIAVSEIEYVDNEAFCVMKYEAKTRKGTRQPTRFGANRIIQAESLADGDLITLITEETAIQFCKQNGAGYNLINNDEWQSIAKHIEFTASNWSNNTIDVTTNNRLNIGYSGSGAKSNSDTNDERSVWDFHKRSHQLFNNEYIWDFAGNLWEIVQHNIQSVPVDYIGYVAQIPQELRNLFGPQRDYSIYNSRERTRLFGGLGHIQTSKDSFKGALLRGGAHLRTAGVFSADMTRSENQLRRLDVGFRCVYHP